MGKLFSISTTVASPTSPTAFSKIFFVVVVVEERSLLPSLEFAVVVLLFLFMCPHTAAVGVFFDCFFFFRFF